MPTTFFRKMFEIFFEDQIISRQKIFCCNLCFKKTPPIISNDLDDDVVSAMMNFSRIKQIVMSRLLTNGDLANSMTKFLMNLFEEAISRKQNIFLKRIRQQS